MPPVRTVSTLFLNNTLKILLDLAEWAKEQIEMYAKMFRSQVYNADIGPDVVSDAMQVTRTQSRKVRARGPAVVLCKFIKLRMPTAPLR